MIPTAPSETSTHIACFLPKASTAPEPLPVVQPSIGHVPSARPDELLVQLETTRRLIGEAQSGLESSVADVSIIIPVFNEFKTILQVIDAVESLPISKQVIVVDDGSTDGTRDLLRRRHGTGGFHVVMQPRNQGKGAAIQTGIQYATGSVVIVQDADLEYSPQDILQVVKPILDGESDVVFGSRYLGNSHQDQSFIHRLGNAFLTGFSNWMTNQKLTDMETCYKAFRRELIQGIAIEQKRFGFEPEITAKIAKKKIVIREVPIGYRSRTWKEGKKIGVKDLVNTLWCIVKYRFEP
jgi:glycosyltransferase involved in cell wall biosynthesis